MTTYKYGMRLRGFAPMCQPMDGLIERVDDPNHKYHDILIYERELTEKEINDYELDDLNTIYILYTGDGDKWEYNTLDEARRTQYIFGGTIIKKGATNDNNSEK